MSIFEITKEFMMASCLKLLDEMAGDSLLFETECSSVIGRLLYEAACSFVIGPPVARSECSTATGHLVGGLVYSSVIGPPLSGTVCSSVIGPLFFLRGWLLAIVPRLMRKLYF